VRELDHGRLIYIILLTAKNQREDLLEGLEAGADDYVTKPFDRQELKARLQVGARVVELQGKLIEAEKSRVLAETAGAASHEINQPLTIALGKLDLLMMKLGDDNPHLKDVDAIQNAIQRIEDIVKKMGSAHKYVTKPYIQGIDIVDFDASADE
jgi:CheY-like chemotaxis protein